MKINKKKFKEKMIEKCLNNRELSKISGISEGTITRIINGDTEPRLKTLGLIVKVLKCDVADLLEEK
ncbi:helix-turn-helix domain-containing protein [Fusobacterium necrogenes]|uniref:helix-turn-helix domain-containing protein n=1 Tax=Fusobacterium necrogenes TaxID=858 RepID=UPI002047F683|nr:helix-turn-helix transcriptional regulator [Fusobacterium necrogenes]DAL66132.1 MAG TPA_asm: Helix-turn-helix XRE-family like protein [Caudoviricetes sp.]